MIPLLILSFATFLLSLLTTGRLLQRFSQNLLDIPNDVASATLREIAPQRYRDRTSHSQPTPRGGLGFTIAFAIAP